jgi:hypothetical protein
MALIDRAVLGGNTPELSHHEYPELFPVSNPRPGPCNPIVAIVTRNDRPNAASA